MESGVSKIFAANRNDITEWKEIGTCLTGSLPIEFQDPSKYTYYMRRGHRYYFKNFYSRVSMYLRNMPIKLKYGQEICLDVTFKS